MLRVYAHMDPRTASFSVFVSERDGGQRFAIEPDAEGRVGRRAVDPGGEIKPLLIVSHEIANDVFPQLIDALADIGFVGNKQRYTAAPIEAHLKDAQTVRDRLLTMIEHAPRNG